MRLTPHARVLWERSRRALEHARGDRVSDGDIVEAVANAFLLTWLPFWVEAVLLGDPIAVREKFRCIVPGCTVHGGSAHHIVYRGLGGSDDPSNLAFVCFSHHILGEHADRLRISGTAPDRLRVELGLRPDGAALETFVGGVRCGELPREQLGALPGAAPAAGA